MPIELHRRHLWLLALLAGAVLAGLPPGEAGARFTCEERGRDPEGIVLRGLPARPTAGRTYMLTVILPDGRGPNPSPNLGAQYCGDAMEPEKSPRMDAWFLRAGEETSRVFLGELRFPRPGPWALSFMDLDGSFYDVGLRHVSSRGPIGGASATATAGGSATSTSEAPCH